MTGTQNDTNTQSVGWRDGFAVLVIVAVLLFIYWPALIHEFGFHNDYRVRDVLDYSFDTSSWRGMLKHLESMHLLYIGRPVNAIAFNLHQSLFHTVADFTLGRLATLVLTIGLALALFLFLRLQLQVSRVHAVALSIATYALPSFQLYISWVANFVPGTLNIAVSVTAFHCAHAAWVRSPALLSRKNWLWVAAAFMLLEVAMLNYPPTAFFLLFYLFLFVAYSPAPLPEVKTFSKRILALSVVSLGAYFVIYKLIYFPWMQGFWGAEFKTYDANTYAFSLLSNETPIRLVADLFRFGLLAWMPANNQISYPIINGMIVILGALIWICLPTERNQGKSVLESATEGDARLHLMLYAALLCIAPFLISPKSFVAYRVQAPWFAMFAVIVVAAYLRVARLVGVLLARPYAATLGIVIVMVMLIASARSMVDATVANATTELNVFKKELAQLPKVVKKEKIKILVVLPRRYALFVDYPLQLDLAYTATNYSGLMYGIIHMIAEEQEISRTRYQWDQEASPDKYVLESADIVIDLRNESKCYGVCGDP